MLILLVFAFLAGVVTVLSPCILPVLPIVLSGTIGGGKRKPLGVVTGFIVSFTFLTLFLSSLVQWTGISADALRLVSVAVIAGFGASLWLPQLQTALEKLFSGLGQFVPRVTGDGWWAGLGIGLSLGLLWTPCVGPILAAVISLALTGSVSGTAALITLAYALGTGLPMLAITYGGRNLLLRWPWLTQHTVAIQKGFGVIMIVTALAIALNWDRRFQTWILTTFPSYGVGLTQLEDNELVRQQLQNLDASRADSSAATGVQGQPMYELTEQMNRQLPKLFVAPELIPGGQWFNTQPITLQALRGKVVLVDFWTYSCINCLRTLPYLRQWHQNYAAKGLVIIGVHSPEFEFEKSAHNVEQALQDLDIHYPVMQDNEFATWKAYRNRYWPAKYLIDQEGDIRYVHFGEGEYVETENAIRQLLDEAPLVPAEEPGLSWNRPTPETYLGYERAQSYAAELEFVPDEAAEYNFQKTLPADTVGLRGTWILGSESITAQTDAELDLNFEATQVYLVLTPPATDSGTVKVFLDGVALSASNLTTDTNEKGIITVDEARKYDLIQLDKFGRHTLKLEVSPGVSAYAFTFGS